MGVQYFLKIINTVAKPLVWHVARFPFFDFGMGKLILK